MISDVSGSHRPLTDQEFRIIDRLITLAPTEQQATLRSFIGRAEAGDSCSCGCGSFSILIDGEGTKTRHYLIAEGFVERKGLPYLGVMLFASDGRPNYLEFYAPERLDGDPPLQAPSPEDIKP